MNTTRNPLRHDQAAITVENLLDVEVRLYHQISACEDCPLTVMEECPPGNTTAVVDTNYENVLQVRHAGTILCTRPYEVYQDQGQYFMKVGWNAVPNCTMDNLVPGRDNAWPLVTLGTIIIMVVALCVSVRIFLQRRRCCSSRETRPRTLTESAEEDEPMNGESMQVRLRERLQCLDAFRGMTVLLMVFVEYGGGGYIYFDHSPWFGLTIADVIFPWFVFIMGSTIALSLRKDVLQRQSTPVKEFKKIARRAINLFIIGIMLNSMYETSFIKLRIPGVLQRLSVSYLVVASIHLVSLTRRQVLVPDISSPWHIYHLSDVLPFWPEWIVIIILLCLYFFGTLIWHYDDYCPRGYQGPGGLYDNARYPNCTGGAARQLDLLILGENHLHPVSRAAKIYATTLRHDPEGILGTTTSIFLTFMGLQAGKVLSAYSSPKRQMLGWIAWAALLFSLTLLTSASGLIPICKSLWSFSFVTLTGGLSFVILIMLYILIDLKRLWPRGIPFNYLGVNAILIYIGQNICRRMLPWYFDVDESSHWWLTFRVSLATILWLLVAVVLVRHDITVTI